MFGGGGGAPKGMGKGGDGGMPSWMGAAAMAGPYAAAMDAAMKGMGKGGCGGGGGCKGGMEAPKSALNWQGWK